MVARQRSWWGWGYADAVVPRPQREAMAARLSARFDMDVTAMEPPTIDDLSLPKHRLQPPAALKEICSTTTADRAGHSFGKSYRDVVRALRAEIKRPPDVVAFPRTEGDVIAVLDWAVDAGAAVIPYGGGSSVCGGVEPGEWADNYTGVVTIDLCHLDKVLEIDRVSRAARIQAGVYGPALEDQLRPHGLTLRHFPQSFEMSSLGGWIATRSGGHFATNYTHIDDFVENLRIVTPAGISQSKRLPGSGAGPSPDRMFIGSEGILGVITEAWMRLQDRPRYRASAGVHFAEFDDAVAAATRSISQAALFPSNCRLLTAGEAASAAGVDDGSTLLVLGFESADHPVDAWIDRAVELCHDHKGNVPDGVQRRESETRTDAGGSVETWRNSFINAPYTGNALATMAVISDTFETAITWDRFPAFHADVMEKVGGAINDVCGAGTLTCRFTHVYPDGPAPYYTFLAPSRRGSELSQWDEIKATAGDVIVKHGATITHHHAVGRDHRPWYDKQRPEPFAVALRAAKSALDPGWALNPGVLIDR